MGKAAVLYIRPQDTAVMRAALGHAAEDYARTGSGKAIAATLREYHAVLCEQLEET